MNSKKMDNKNKIMLISGISVVALAMSAILVSALHTPSPPNPKELGPRSKVAYMASKEFSRLPEREKMKYMAEARPSPGVFRSLNEKERQALFKNTRKIMHKQMKQRLKEFFKMSKEEQNKALDKMIDEHDRRRKEWEANRENNNNRRPPGNHNERMQGMLEGTDSDTRAQMHEYHKRMEERRKQTGK